MYSPITGTGNGTAPVVNLTFPYLAKAHVIASVDGTPVAYTWSGASQITFSAPVANGSAWEVSRNSSADARLVDFTDGSVLTEADLDLDSLQAFYRAQELDHSISDVATTIAGIPQGPPGDVSKALTRSELASTLNPAANMSRFLVEPGREGLWVYEAANHSAHVTADPQQGLYVAPVADTTGASGAWVRKFTGALNVQWFGAVADGDAGTPTDSGPAFLAALTALQALAIPTQHGYSHGTPSLFIPAGVYWLNTTTLDITRSMILFGENAADATGGSSVLKFAQNTTMIRVQSGNTTGASGTQADAGYSGSGSIIKNLMLIGSGGADADYHGIHLRGKASIRDVYIENIQGDGIYANVTAGSGGATEGNANNVEVSRVYMENVRNGLFLDGSDTNAGVFTAINVKNARAWGIYDSSFLGNTHIAHHVSGSALGAYKSEGANNRSAWISLYSEGGQPTAVFDHPAVIVGGTHSAGISGTAAQLMGDSIFVNEDTLANFRNLRAGRIFHVAPDVVGLHGTVMLDQGGVTEVDGVTPMAAAAIMGDTNTTNPANAEGYLYFGSRTYTGGGAITWRFLYDGPGAALRPYNTGDTDFGQTGARWKNGWFSGNITLGGNLAATGTVTGSNLSGTNTGDTLVLIGKQTPNGVSSVSFTSIPQTYTHLKLVIVGRVTGAVVSTSAAVTFNNDTGANYDQVDTSSAGSTTNTSGTTNGATSIGAALLAGASATAGYAGDGILEIFNYADTNLNKRAHSLQGLTTGTGAGAVTVKNTSAGWRSAAAINRIDVTSGSGNFAAGTVISLYGLV